VSFLDRYVAGEHAKVWSELCAMGPAVRDVQGDARAVANEMARRVQHDIELLQARWEERGYVFGYGWAGSWASAMVERAPPRLGQPADPAALDDYEARVGPLPLSLPYLRETILVRGGIGPFGMAKRRSALTKDLPLQPF
jgi:hypothetical protein